MLTQESTDKEILDYPIDQAGNILRDMGSISFMGWVANKLNGVDAFRADTQELLMMVKNPMIGRMPEGEKIRVIKKLLSLGIQL